MTRRLDVRSSRTRARALGLFGTAALLAGSGLDVGCEVASIGRDGTPSDAAGICVRDVARFGVLPASAPLVWSQAKRTLSALGERAIEVDDESLEARAAIDGANVVVLVTPRDSHSANVEVRARKSLASDVEIARRVFDAIVSELAQRPNAP